MERDRGHCEAQHASLRQALSVHYVQRDCSRRFLARGTGVPPPLSLSRLYSLNCPGKNCSAAFFWRYAASSTARAGWGTRSM
jgi:hypothetical protein